uniref:serine/arginine repetitive matrix protein 1-like isoform X2 n=1 Tax=Oncorhynchus gorbuscha TaxID=8017 RepID=UPI001EAF3EB9|nr:serine/arginine repetitive matrix protein 1-like isoform X2 [Oncorhynchus gorbuscha]
MNSPEDSSSSSTRKTSVWADQQTATAQLGVSPPSPTHCFGDGEGTRSAIPAETPVSTNPSCPSQTLVSPQKKRTAEKGTFDASQPQGERRKRGRPRKNKKPQTDTEHHIHQAQSPTATHPCLQPEDQTEAVTLTPSSPVIPKDRCQSSEATFEPPCPALDLQSANKGQSKNGPHLSSASVGQGDRTGPNVLVTGIFISKCAKEQKTLCQSPHNLKDGRKAAKKSQIHNVDQPQETVTNGENTSKPLLTIKVGQENCLTQKTGLKRKYTKKSQSHKVGQPRDTDQSQESETVRNGENTSIKSPTHKIDWSQETVRKRTYTKKTQSHKGDKPQETVRNGKKTTMKSPTHQVHQSQELVTKRKKVSKISSTHKVDHSQETVKKRKYTKKSQTREIDQSQSPETGKNTSMKSLTNKVASKKSQSHTVEQSLGIDQSQETVRKRNYTKKSQKHKEDSNETVRNGEKTSQKSQKHKVELRDTEQSQEETVKNRKYTKKSKTHKVDSGVLSLLPVLSADVSLNLSSPTFSSTGLPKRKYTKKSQTLKVDSDVPSSLIVLSADLSSSLQSSLSPTRSPSGIPFSPNTHKRFRGRPQRVQQQLFLSSTPGPHPRSSTGTDNSFSASPSHVGLGPRNASPITPCQLLELSPLEKTHLALPGSKARGRPRVRSKNSATVKGVKTPGGKKKVKAAAEGGSQTSSSEEGPPAKLGRRSRKGQTAEGAGLQSGYTTSTEPRSRPRFELQESDSPDTDTGDASLSSDLSIELSVQEDCVTSLTLEEEDEQDDEEDLPSFLNNTKPLSITEGICVWCKFRSYPFWPAMVKSVNRKLKKASIVFIDDLLFDKKRIRKGFSVSLKTLKPFDCEEADQLVDHLRPATRTADETSMATGRLEKYALHG